MKFPCDYIIHCEPNEKEKEVTWSDFEELIRCRDCKHSEPWYRDRRRCFLWNEGGISVWDDGFCNYTERKED